MTSPRPTNLRDPNRGTSSEPVTTGRQNLRCRAPVSAGRAYGAGSSAGLKRRRSGIVLPATLALNTFAGTAASAIAVRPHLACWRRTALGPIKVSSSSCRLILPGLGNQRPRQEVGSVEPTRVANAPIDHRRHHTSLLTADFTFHLTDLTAVRNARTASIVAVFSGSTSDFTSSSSSSSNRRTTSSSETLEKLLRHLRRRRKTSRSRLLVDCDVPSAPSGAARPVSCRGIGSAMPPCGRVV